MKVINALFLLAPSLSALAISCCESFLITVSINYRSTNENLIVEAA